MKWIHQVDSAFSSIVIYSPTDHFVACARTRNNYSYDTAYYYECHVSADAIREQLKDWLSKQDSQMVRLIEASGELRAMIRELEPSLFM